MTGRGMLGLGLVVAFLMACGGRLSSKPVVAKTSTADEKRLKTYPGVIKTAVVSKAIAAKMDKVRRCYERELIKGRKHRGRLEARFIIATTGKVKTLAFTVNELGSTIGACVRKALNKITLPPPEGGEAEIIYPFIFSAK